VVHKRLTKRQIKQDPLMEWTARIEEFASANLRRILIGVGAVALVIALVFVLRGARRDAELQASALLAQAQFQLWTGSPAQAAQLAQQVVDHSSGTRSGRVAHLVRGDALLQTGDSEGALAAYRTFLAREKRDPVLRLSARRGIAVSLENLAQHAEAAAAYEELAREAQDAAPITQDLMAAARCLERAGEVARAEDLYQEILGEYPTEPLATDAKVKLIELEHRTASAES
jgi:tetratricopeptide (TPR) repeat protein